MGTVRGYRRGTSLLWVRRSTAESASGVQCPQWQQAEWECAELALRAHQSFSTVRAPCLPTACARAAGEGSDWSALLRARGMSGDACRGHRAGAVRQQGRCGALRGDPRARDVTKDYSKGHPIPWVRCTGTVGAHRCCGCGAVPPSPLRVCRYLNNNNKLTGSVPSSLSALTKLAYLCVPPSCQRVFVRVRPGRGRIGRLCSERAACRGMHAGGIEGGRCSSRAVAAL
jgi:hypothetical protein